MDEAKTQRLVALLRNDLAHHKQIGTDQRLKRVKRRYLELCKTPSDINEHLPTIYRYAQQCSTVFETGVRGVVSTWALAYGILSNPAASRRILLLNDIHPCEMSEVERAMEGLGVSVEQQWLSNLDLRFSEHTTFDLTFIDTWHVYGQLRRELAKFAPITNKYIILHDTEGDGIEGETIRLGGDAHKQSKASGIPVEEILKGLQPAIDEFLKQHSEEWVLKECFRNNNGLTILERKRASDRTAGSGLLALAPQAALGTGFQCRACHECFSSRNKLFDHIAQTGHEAHVSGLKDEKAPPARATVGAGAQLFHDYYRQVLRSVCTAEEWDAVYTRFMTPLPSTVCTYPASSLGRLASQMLLPQAPHAEPASAPTGVSEEMGDALGDALSELGGVDICEDVCGLLPAHLLQVQPDHCVLDLCSSIKTLQLLNRMMVPPNEPAAEALLGVGADADGCLVSNNHDNARQTTLLRKTRSFSGSCYSPVGSGHATDGSAMSATASLLLLAEDAAHLPCVRKANSWKVEFDRVLVHVPSSGDGAHRPAPSKICGRSSGGGGAVATSSKGGGQHAAAAMVAEWQNWSAAAGLKHHWLQVKILVRGLQLLGKGKQHTKRLVYSTHSLNPLENEAVVAAALAVVNSSQGDGANDARRSMLRLVPVLPLPVGMEGEILGLVRNSFVQAGEGESKASGVGEGAKGGRLGCDWLPGLSSWEVPSPKWRDKRREKKQEKKQAAKGGKEGTDVRVYTRADEVPQGLKRVVRASMFPPSDPALAAQLQLCRRVLPTHAHCDGHALFIALFEKELPGADAPAHMNAVAAVRPQEDDQNGTKPRKERKAKTKVDMRLVFVAPAAAGDGCARSLEHCCSFFGLATSPSAAEEAGVQQFPLEGVRYNTRAKQLVLVSRQLSAVGEQTARPLKIVEGGLQLFSFTEDEAGGGSGCVPFDSAAPLFARCATKRVVNWVLDSTASSSGAFDALDTLLAERALDCEQLLSIQQQGLVQGLHTCSIDGRAQPGAVIVTSTVRVTLPSTLRTRAEGASTAPDLSMCLVCKLTAEGGLQLLTPSYSAAHWQVLLAAAHRRPSSRPSRPLTLDTATSKPVAVCFYGLTRSLKWTLPSIEKYIFAALDEQRVQYRVYLHTFTLPGDALTNARTGENGEALDRDEWRGLCFKQGAGGTAAAAAASRGVRPAKHVVESQAEYLEGQGLSLVQDEGAGEGQGGGLHSYLRHGDHWHDGGQSVLNLLCQLRSLKQVTELWDESDHDVAIYVRPDLRYLTPLRLDEIERCRAERCVLMPAWQTYNGCNDRLCIGDAHAMKHAVGCRGDHVHSYAQQERLHAEGFLRHSLERADVPWGATSMRAQRVRANGKTDPRDIGLDAPGWRSNSR
jgi:16S rRNA C967 or C1407 C5-methylase (RsmB/RsmF family)